MSPALVTILCSFLEATIAKAELLWENCQYQNLVSPNLANIKLIILKRYYDESLLEYVHGLEQLNEGNISSPRHFEIKDQTFPNLIKVATENHKRGGYIVAFSCKRIKHLTR